MTVEQVQIRDHLVMRDDANTWRWFSAVGPNATQYVTQFQSLPADDSTTDPTEFVNTITENGAGVSTAVMTDLAGGGLIITTAAQDGDGYQMQLGNANSGEWVNLAGDYPLYFGVEFALNDATQTDCLFGFAVTDSDVLGGVTDGLYFRKVDASTALNFVLEKDSVESATSVATLADDTYVTAEFFYFDRSVKAYIDGTLMATVADSSASFPNDELMRLTMEFLTGENVANTCTIKWIRLIQIRD
jgi:hypothetical protein